MRNAIDRDELRCYQPRMSGFTKLHGSIIHSSVWSAAYHVRVVWITMLAMADEVGLVSASIGGMAKAAGVSREECIESLDLFMAPDPDSRTKELEGRRIEEVPGGWVLVNHGQYRDRRTDSQVKAADRARRYRERRRKRLAGEESERDESCEDDPLSRDVTTVTTVTDYPTEEEAEAEAEAEAESEAEAEEKRVPATKKRPKRSQPAVHSMESIQAAQCLFDAIRSHKPDFKAAMQPARIGAMLGGWAKDIDVGMRVDGMTLEGCEAAINAAHCSADTFWRGNLLSGKKLRKHYEALRIRGGPKVKPAALPDSFDFGAFGKEMGLGG